LRKQLTWIEESRLRDAEWNGIALEGDSTSSSRTSVRLPQDKMQQRITSAEIKRQEPRAKRLPDSDSEQEYRATSALKKAERVLNAQDVCINKDVSNQQSDTAYPFIDYKYWRLKEDETSSDEDEEGSEECTASDGGRTATDGSSSGGRVDDDGSISGGRERRIQLTEDEIDQHYREGRCFNCHKRGHISRKCRQLQTSIVFSSQINSPAPSIRQDTASSPRKHEISTPKSTITFGTTIPEIDLPNHDSRFTADSPSRFNCFTTSKQLRDEPRQGSKGTPMTRPRMQTTMVNVPKRIPKRSNIDDESEMLKKVVDQPLRQPDEQLHAPLRPSTKPSDDSIRISLNNPKPKSPESRRLSSRIPQTIPKEQLNAVFAPVPKSKTGMPKSKIPVAKSNDDPSPPKIRKVRFRKQLEHVFLA
jgi:hypothetical protein